jgi:hypothetical protein
MNIPMQDEKIKKASIKAAVALRKASDAMDKYIRLSRVLRSDDGRILLRNSMDEFAGFLETKNS